MKELKVFEVVPAGQPFLDLITETLKDFDEVTEVRITAFDLPKDKVAAFDPMNGVIIIDMGNAAIPNQWMRRGASIIASAWFNLIFGLFHERAHLRQVRENAELKGLAHATEIMEAAANAEANSSILAWAENNPAIPSLDELGFVGEHIKEVLNDKYSEHTESVLRELELNGSNQVAISVIDGKLAYLQTKAFLTNIIGDAPGKDETEMAQDRVDEEAETKFLVTSA